MLIASLNQKAYKSYPKDTKTNQESRRGCKLTADAARTGRPAPFPDSWHPLLSYKLPRHVKEPASPFP